MVKETKLVDLLNKKEIRLDLSELQNVYIRDVFLDSNVRSLSLQLVSKFLVNEGELIKLQEVLKTKLPKFEDIEVNILYDIDEKDLNLIMNKYWANLVCFIEKEIPSSSGWIKNLEWKMEGTNFILICDSEVISYALKKNNIEKMISQKIKKELGINVVVTVSFVANSVDMDELLIKKIEEEEKELAQNIAIDENSNDIKDGKEAFNKNTNYIYGKNIEGDLTKLCNIDSNTGTAIVEGELFQIESREIKGGKILFTFNITDYTNSITVKAFIKKKDKEEFEFYIKEGVLQKLKGM